MYVGMTQNKAPCVFLIVLLFMVEFFERESHWRFTVTNLALPFSLEISSQLTFIIQRSRIRYDIICILYPAHLFLPPSQSYHLQHSRSTTNDQAMTNSTINNLLDRQCLTIFGSNSRKTGSKKQKFLLIPIENKQSTTPIFRTP